MDIHSFLEAAEEIPVVDVRTPAEYRQGHIPCARNIPLFSDEERKAVGITYKKEGRQGAVMKGLALAGPSLVKKAREGLRLAGKKGLLLYCWRGGMRSDSMAWMYELLGISCRLLDGGYKSYRKYVLERFDRPTPFLVIGGFTGSGKTEAINALGQRAEAVIDLEGLARHKGSAFGGLGAPPQPSNEHFENMLAWELDHLPTQQWIWVEDESRSIGRNMLPAGLFEQLRSAPLIFLDLPLSERINRLVKEYAGFPEPELKQAVIRVEKRLGGKRTREALTSIENKDFARTAAIMLEYYDKTYAFGLSKRDPDRVFHLKPSQTKDIHRMMEEVLDLSKIISRKFASP